jgi:hypothetical protein
MGPAVIFLELIPYPHQHKAAMVLIAMAMAVVAEVLLAELGVIWDMIIGAAELVDTPDWQPAERKHPWADPRPDQIHNIGQAPLASAAVIGKLVAAGV